MEDDETILTIFVGPVYSVVCTKSGNEIGLFDVFAEDEISLHVFMASFVKGRAYFCYDTFFFHYAIPESRRKEIIGAGGVAVSKEGEVNCIYDWHKKVVEKRFM